MKTKLLIVGGSDAGISAGLRARELDREADVTVLLADDHPNFSICGLPFFLSGEVPDWRALAHRTTGELLRQGVRLLPRHRATAILPEAREVVATGPDAREVRLAYDKLIVATGAVSKRPRALVGRENPGVFPLRWMGDGLAIDEYVRHRKPTSVVIVGGGYIGMEMADAFTRRGLRVIVAGRSVLKTVDSPFGALIRAELERNGVRVVEAPVATVQAGEGSLLIATAAGFQTQADMVLVAAGAVPEVGLAEAAGIELGHSGAIKVTGKMETNLADVYAAGDCVETWHRLLGHPVYLPLGTTAHKQGRIAGENAVGGQRVFSGSLGTQVVKIFDLVVARTGLRDAEALAEGFSPLTVATEGWDHKNYYPGAQRLWLRVTGDKTTGRLLGAQILGHRQSEVAKRIDVVATAIFHGMRVADMEQLDLSYTPPLGSPWDPVQISAQAWCRAHSRDRGEPV
uniref:NAD(FAD)-dependent dehydrogenase n=1 Tax=Desulfovibrio sp. U5L TaxID=596152 RepID=I2Q6M8_9BACT